MNLYSNSNSKINNSYASYRSTAFICTFKLSFSPFLYISFRPHFNHYVPNFEMFSHLILMNELVVKILSDWPAFDCYASMSIEKKNIRTHTRLNQFNQIHCIFHPYFLYCSRQFDKMINLNCCCLLFFLFGFKFDRQHQH